MAIRKALWFDDMVYMRNKLQQMREINHEYSEDQMYADFDAAGFKNEEGRFLHFLKYGNRSREDISPNPYFVPSEYYRYKAQQYYNLDSVDAVTDAQALAMETAIKKAGMSAWTHYIRYGTREGINPSSQFNTKAYMIAKLEALFNANIRDSDDNLYTEESLYAAFRKAGLNALEHAIQYGTDTINTKSGEVACWFDSDHTMALAEFKGDSFDSLTIPQNHFEYNNHCYAIFNSCATLEEAKEYAESLGGHIATFSSLGENNAVYEYVKSEGYANAYFGLSDSLDEGDWRWITKEKQIFTNWHSGEPNNESGNEDYAMFYYKFSDGTWNDGNFGEGTVSDDKVFICEWENTVKSELNLKYIPKNILISQDVLENIMVNTFDLYFPYTEVSSQGKDDITISMSSKNTTALFTNASYGILNESSFTYTGSATEIADFFDTLTVNFTISALSNISSASNFQEIEVLNYTLQNQENTTKSAIPIHKSPFVSSVFLDKNYDTNNYTYFLNGVSDANYDMFEKNSLGNMTYSSPKIIDAEKNGLSAHESEMCWAAAASNMLVSTGWADFAGTNLNEDDIYKIFSYNYKGSNWFNYHGHNEYFGIQWFFDGTVNHGTKNHDYPTSSNSGNFVGISSDPYLYHQNADRLDGHSLLTIASQVLLSGCAVSLGINYSDKEIGHALTCWGFAYDDSLDVNDIGFFKGVFVTDSDDNLYDSSPNNTLCFYPIVWSYSDDEYMLYNYSEDFQYKIKGINVLQPYCPDNMQISCYDSLFTTYNLPNQGDEISTVGVSELSDGIN